MCVRVYVYVCMCTCAFRHVRVRAKGACVCMRDCGWICFPRLHVKELQCELHREIEPKMHWRLHPVRVQQLPFVVLALLPQLNPCISVSVI